MTETNDQLDRDVRWQVYDVTMRTGIPPSSRQVAQSLHVEADDALATFRRLADAHILVLQRDSGEILMANPFSAVPTPFAVDASGLLAYGNCIWDALGIPAMLNRDARITTSCGDCGTMAEVVVESGSVRGEGVIHFAIPAREWWNDIVFT